MSPYPFTPLPCQLCNTFACATPEEPSHDSPVMIALAHASKVESSTACTIFCGDDSPFNTVCILHDAADKFSRAEAILHTAAMSLKNIAAFLAGNPQESATGAAAIRRIMLKVDRPDFVAWYEAEDRGPMSPRCAGLLRALDDAAALVGECGEYRPDVKFVLPVKKAGAVVLFAGLLLLCFGSYLFIIPVSFNSLMKNLKELVVFSLFKGRLYRVIFRHPF